MAKEVLPEISQFVMMGAELPFVYIPLPLLLEMTESVIVGEELEQCIPILPLFKMIESVIVGEAPLQCIPYPLPLEIVEFKMVGEEL